MDFNKGSELQQKTTKKGEIRYKICFSKVTKIWHGNSSKGGKILKEHFASSRQSLEISKIPNFLRNIVSVSKLDKQDIRYNQSSSLSQDWIISFF